MKIYLGGKMIGRPEFGFAEFDEAAALLRALGHEVFNPAERDRAAGFKPAGTHGTPEELLAVGFSRREALAADMAWIAAYSEGMVVLDTWTDSPGTIAEVAFHQGLYLPVWPLADFLAFGPAAPALPRLVPGRAAA